MVVADMASLQQRYLPVSQLDHEHELGPHTTGTATNNGRFLNFPRGISAAPVHGSSSSSSASSRGGGVLEVATEFAKGRMGTACVDRQTLCFSCFSLPVTQLLRSEVRERGRNSLAGQVAAAFRVENVNNPPT